MPPEVGPAAGSTADLVQAAGQAVSAALESAAGHAVSGLANLADRSTVDEAC